MRSDELGPGLSCQGQGSYRVGLITCYRGGGEKLAESLRYSGVGTFRVHSLGTRVISMATIIEIR